MDLLRSAFDSFYSIIKPVVFRMTADDPQYAHELFVQFCQFLYEARLEELVLGDSRNAEKSGFELSNAAGFNKNGEIPPTVLRYLGFDRVVVGTVTFDAWKGNPRPNIKRYPESESMINWMGLPGEGARAVAKRLFSYEDHKIPLTINLMSTPGKTGHDLTSDIMGTVLLTRDLPYLHRYELNISCPNTHTSSGLIDTRTENLAMLEKMILALENYSYPHHELYVKVSPDSTESDVTDTLSVIANHGRITGIVSANTTTIHDRNFILQSPKFDGRQVGGASGDAVYEASLRTQKMYFNDILERELDLKIIACGGINTSERVSERLLYGASEIQVFTPLIFSGTELLRKLRKK